MMKKKLILADLDEMYLANLSNYFMEKAPQLELFTFTDGYKLLQYLKQGIAADIFVVDENMLRPEMAALAKDMTKIALSVSMNKVDGFELIKKYQKSETLLNEILLKFAEDTGTEEVIHGKSHTRIAAFYSPAGGSGKTVLALSTAVSAVNMGLRVLYLNLEEIDSVSDIFEKTPGTLTDIFLALKTKGMKVGIRLVSSIGIEHSAGFSYLSGVESISEYEEITGNDVRRLLDSVQSLSEYDLVILDMSSGFTERTKEALDMADVIFTPVTSEEGAISKIMRFLGEMNLHDTYTSIFKKMNLIVNKANANGVGIELQASGLLNHLPCCAVIVTSPIFMRRADILRSGTMLCQPMNLIVQKVMSL